MPPPSNCFLSCYSNINRKTFERDLACDVQRSNKFHHHHYFFFKTFSSSFDEFCNFCFRLFLLFGPHGPRLLPYGQQPIARFASVACSACASQRTVWLRLANARQSQSRLRRLYSASLRVGFCFNQAHPPPFYFNSSTRFAMNHANKAYVPKARGSIPSPNISCHIPCAYLGSHKT